MAENPGFQGDLGSKQPIELQEIDMDEPAQVNNNKLDKENESGTRPKNGLLYSVSDIPPWYLSIVLGFQQYLTLFGATLAAPLVVASAVCVGDNYLAQTEILGTMFFVGGIATLLQTLGGTRLPIVQGASFAFIAPIYAVMSLPQWKCPAELGKSNATNVTEAWKPRMAEIQGALMVASVVEVVVGFTGLIGLVMRFIGPITIAPTIALIGISLVGAAVGNSSSQWAIALLTVALIAIFSQYMRNIGIPVCSWKDGKFQRTTLNVFTLFPIILSIGLVWLLCYILTITEVWPNDPNVMGYKARTDIKLQVLQDAAWFRMPYPGQWGMPTVSVGGVMGMLAAVLASMIESIGDYYACARLAGAPPPPTHAVNRGIFVEGIGCILAGAFGCGTGTTSYSENIGAIGITKVGSRRVVEVAALVMITLGLLNKFGALFVTMPEPIVGGIFLTMFGMVTSVGISNLQFVDLNSPRNLFVIGLALLSGLALPQWIATPAAKELVKTGNDPADQIIQILLSTSMFIGGLVACFLDNTIPGTRTERGLLAWKTGVTLTSAATSSATSSSSEPPRDHYDLPFRASRWLDRVKCFHYLPICPVFKGWPCDKTTCCKRKGETTDL